MDTVFSILTALVVLEGIFLFFNIFLQRRAEKRFEKLLQKEKPDLIRKLKETDLISKHWRINNEAEKDEIEMEVLLMLLRSKIDRLGYWDKKVLNKSFDRKTYNDQKRYAIRIFSDSGLLDIFKRKGKGKDSYSVA